MATQKNSNVHLNKTQVANQSVTSHHNSQGLSSCFLNGTCCFWKVYPKQKQQK